MLRVSILRPTPFSPNLPEKALKGMLYERRLYDIPPGQRKPFLTDFGEKLMPLFEKLGAKVIGVWHTPIGHRNEVLCLLAFRDIAQRMDFWEKVKSAETELGFTHCENSVVSALLRPTRLSPMK